jgi:hypothetical protein
MENLYKSFSLFIEAMRAYITSALMREAGEKWPERFTESLTPDQKRVWDQGIQAGSTPNTLIDYPHLIGFALKNKELLRKDFGPAANGLPTLFKTIVDVRNSAAHFQKMTSDQVADA